jgi:hypothetical protein
MKTKMLSKEQLDQIAEITFRTTSEAGLRHAGENLPYVKKTVRDLKRELRDKPKKPALVVSAGPSLHRQKSLETIKNSRFDGYVVAVDGSLGHCLRNGIVPDFLVSVDPDTDDSHRILRWFGDPHLSERPDDDYFRRQDLDPALNVDEAAKNTELLELVNRHGPRIKALISTSVGMEITKRVTEAGFDLYWWNPLYDDYEAPDSLSRKVRELTGAPCVVTGGNVGSSAWVLAHTILGSQEVIVVGMDFSYAPGTKAENTQYYEILKETYPDNPDKGLIKIYNPHLDQVWLTDPAYYWYAQCFIEMASQAECVTYNCTEGGIAFGEGIRFMKLAEALEIVGTKKDI